MIALAEKCFADRNGALGHEGLEPAERHVALGRLLHLLDQPQHLVEPVDVERKQYPVKDHRRQAAEQDAVGDEGDVAGKADDAQRNHGAHRERRNDESGREKTDQGDVVHVSPNAQLKL